MVQKSLIGRSKKVLLTTAMDVSIASGFTLLEVIITLTILGFVLLIIFGAFRLGLSAWERGESTREEYQKLRAASQLISRQIKSIVPYKIKTKKAEGDYLAFEGKAHSVRFVSALPIKKRQPEGFVYVVYEFKEGGEESGRLILHEQRALNKDFFEETLKEELKVSLFEGVSSVRFEYYRKGDSNKNLAEGWVEEWSTKEEKELPRALKMTLTYKNRKKEGEVLPLTLRISIPAHQFDEVRTVPPLFGRGTIRDRPQP
jgi:general secretion pathway protein J